MKKIMLSLLLLTFSATLYAHCGSCGVGNEKESMSSDYSTTKTKDGYCGDHDKKSHHHKSKLALSKKQEKALKKVLAGYNKDLVSVQDEFMNDISKVLKNKEEAKIYFSENI